MDVVFFGSGAFGLPTLERLAGRHTLRGIVTQPDRPAGRGSRLTPTPVGAWAADNAPAVALVKPERVGIPAVVDAIRAMPADAWVVIAFGQKLPAPLLAGRFAINLHASLLPRWRGAAPIHAAIVAGDRETGNSVITLAQRMDAGAVLAQGTRPIERRQTAGALHDLLAADGPDLVERVLADRQAGRLEPREQDESLVTLAPKLSKSDAWVDFAAPARACRCRINGLSPWPGVGVGFRAGRLRLVEAEELEADAEQDAEPGTILDPTAGTIGCGAGTVLRLHAVQPPGRRTMPWRDFANGQRVEPGERLMGAVS